MIRLPCTCRRPPLRTPRAGIANERSARQMLWTYLFGNGIDEPLVVRDDNYPSVPTLYSVHESIDTLDYVDSQYLVPKLVTVPIARLLSR